MYHYIRPDNDEYPNFNSLPFDTFRRQLDFFEKEWGFISKNDYMDAVKSKNNPDGVVLTFDDGLKDHFNYAAAELKLRGLWGAFYIPTGIYSSNQKMLGVQRVHFLNGKYGASKILKEAKSLISDEMINKDNLQKFDKDVYRFSVYKKDASDLRKLFNYILKYKHRDLILDQLMKKFFNESILFSENYLTKDEIIQMNNDGNLIGSHTISHSVMSRLSYDDQRNEIKSSFDFLSNICDIDYKSFCYPYGYKSSYNKDTLEILEELEIDDAVMFDNKKQGKITDQYQLSRIDCNQFMDV